MSASPSVLLEVRNLSVSFNVAGRTTVPVRDISLVIREGERVGVVGESGCGKSLTAMALTRLAPTDRAVLGGSIRFCGQELLGMPENSLRKLRGCGIAYVFQDPSASLNPVMKVHRQITENLPGISRAKSLELSEKLLAETGLPNPARLARSYPCEMSGGQQQRVMLAMALAQRPKLLVADEPTTALDVTTQRKVLELIRSLSEKYSMAVLLITHNLGLVRGNTDRLYVLYGGGNAESGPVKEVLSSPRHPYTRGLLGAVPRLDSPREGKLSDIPGSVPAPDAWPKGCVFAPRCPQADDRCRTAAIMARSEGEREFSCLNA